MFFFSSRRRHTRSKRDWSSDVCSSDLSGERSLSSGVPKEDLFHQVAAGDNSESVLVDDPLRDERALAAVIAGNAHRIAELVIHQQRERAVPVVEGAETIGNPHHAVRSE